MRCRSQYFSFLSESIRMLSLCNPEYLTSTYDTIPTSSWLGILSIPAYTTRQGTIRQFDIWRMYIAKLILGSCMPSIDGTNFMYCNRFFIAPFFMIHDLPQSTTHNRHNSFWTSRKLDHGDRYKYYDLTHPTKAQLTPTSSRTLTRVLKTRHRQAILSADVLTTIVFSDISGPPGHIINSTRLNHLLRPQQWQWQWQQRQQQRHYSTPSK